MTYILLSWYFLFKIAGFIDFSSTFHLLFPSCCSWQIFEMVGFICFSPTFVLKVKRLNFLCLLLFTYFSPTFHLLFHLLSPTFHLLFTYFLLFCNFSGNYLHLALGGPAKHFSPTFHLLFTYFSPTFTYFSPKKCFWRCFWWKLSAFHLNFHQNQCFWPTFHLLFTHFSPTFHLLSFDTTAWVKALPGLWFLFFFYFSPTLWAVDKVGDHFFTNF